MLLCSYPTSRALSITLNSLCIMYAALDTEALGFRVSFCASLKLGNYSQIWGVSLFLLLPHIVSESPGPNSTCNHTNMPPQSGVAQNTDWLTPTWIHSVCGIRIKLQEISSEDNFKSLSRTLKILSIIVISLIDLSTILLQIRKKGHTLMEFIVFFNYCFSIILFIIQFI